LPGYNPVGFKASFKASNYVLSPARCHPVEEKWRDKQIGICFSVSDDEMLPQDLVVCHN
jgi:hypothetical protein